ncbi:MAG: hypothetical protein PGN27_25135 [Mycolicibacterium neoaurum]|uniref:hypothetical protein n=1 Tax=Mycolicibacterium neoaurum TaxID=1795 RepID=UPI002FF68657
MSPSWKELSDAASYEPTVTAVVNVDGTGFVDWRAAEQIVAEAGVRVAVAAGGWRSPVDDELTVGLLLSSTVTADILSIRTARQIVEALQAAIADAEIVDADAALVPLFSEPAR